MGVADDLPLGYVRGHGPGRQRHAVRRRGDRGGPPGRRHHRGQRPAARAAHVPGHAHRRQGAGCGSPPARGWCGWARGRRSCSAASRASATGTCSRCRPTGGATSGSAPAGASCGCPSASWTRWPPAAGPGLYPLSLDVSDRRRDVVSTNVRQPGSLRDHAGRVWFATEHGPLMIDPARLPLNAAAARGAHREGVRRRAPGPARTGQPAAPRSGQPGVPVLGGDAAGAAQEPAPLHAGGVRSAAGSRPDRGGWPTTPTSRPAGTASASRAATPTASGTSAGTRCSSGCGPTSTARPGSTACWAALLLAAVTSLWRLRVRSLRREYLAAFTERSRVARELHDTLLQGMSAVGPAAARPAPAPGQRGARARPASWSSWRRPSPAACRRPGGS